MRPQSVWLFIRILATIVAAFRADEKTGKSPSGVNRRTGWDHSRAPSNDEKAPKSRQRNSWSYLWACARESRNEGQCRLWRSSRISSILGHQMARKLPSRGVHPLHMPKRRGWRRKHLVAGNWKVQGMELRHHCAENLVFPMQHQLPVEHPRVGRTYWEGIGKRLKGRWEETRSKKA